MSRRSKNIRNFEQHDFYCLNCGRRNITIMRPANHLHSQFHRKVLYCSNCKTVINHIECRNDEEAYQFKINYENGIYKEEAKVSKDYMESDKV